MRWGCCLQVSITLRDVYYLILKENESSFTCLIFDFVCLHCIEFASSVKEDLFSGGAAVSYLKIRTITTTNKDTNKQTRSHENRSKEGSHWPSSIKTSNVRPFDTDVVLSPASLMQATLVANSRNMQLRYFLPSSILRCSDIWMLGP